MRPFCLGLSVPKFYVAAFLCSAILVTSLNAQMMKRSTPNANAPADSEAPAPTSTSTPSTSSTAAPAAAPTAGQAPEDVTQKLSALIHAGKYADAQQLTTALLLAYPDDQRLIKAKGLLAQLLAASASAPNSQSANSAPNPPAAPPADQLTGLDKLDYDSLIELAREAQQTTDLAQQQTLLYQFMVKSGPFLQKHPNEMLLWQIRAATALSQNYPHEGYIAGQKLLSLGAENSSDPNVRHLMAQLNLRGWMDQQQAEAQSKQVQADRKQQAADDEAARQKAESDKYTFPVFHVNGLRYAYGHLTINEDEAIYTGTDETDNIAKDDIREVKVACNTDGCGLYFTPNSGRRYFFLAVTEYAVDNQTNKGKVFLQPAVLGNAVVARWKFVSRDKKTLVPSDASGDARRSKF